MINSFENTAPKEQPAERIKYIYENNVPVFFPWNGKRIPAVIENIDWTNNKINIGYDACEESGWRSGTKYVDFIEFLNWQDS